MNGVAPRPHDLLRLIRVPCWPDAPAWVEAELARMPVVVVRRAGAPRGAVAVGVRGAQRNQRYGAMLALCDIAQSVRPEQLGAMIEGGDTRACAPFASCGPTDFCGDEDHAAPRTIEAQAALPAFAALRAIAPALRRQRLQWGPTGSVGFELATGLPVVQASSDLDVLIRAPEWIARDRARSLLGILSQHAACAGVRVDVQLETPAGAIALAEYAGQARRVLLRHGGEPVLVEDPWAWGTQPAAEPASVAGGEAGDLGAPTSGAAV